MLLAPASAAQAAFTLCYSVNAGGLCAGGTAELPVLPPRKTPTTPTPRSAEK
jgi:hypothetical protein